MLTAIQLDDELFTSACKISEVRPDWHLPDESVPAKPPCLQLVPKRAFCDVLAPAKFASARNPFR
jgi:hypothetical protein